MVRVTGLKPLEIQREYLDFIFIFKVVNDISDWHEFLQKVLE